MRNRIAPKNVKVCPLLCNNSLDYEDSDINIILIYLHSYISLFGSLNSIKLYIIPINYIYINFNLQRVVILLLLTTQRDSLYNFKFNHHTPNHSWCL